MEEIKNEELVDQLPEKALKSKAEQYDEKLEAFKAEIEKITDKDALKELEDVVIKDIEDNEKKTAEKAYAIPEKCTFRGTTYTKGKIGEFVVELLGKQEVGWQMTLGLFDIMEFWKYIRNVSSIPYPYYDATLRFLGQQKYSGYETIKKVLAINALFGDSRDEYVDDLATTYFLADKHNAIITRIEAIEAINEPVKTNLKATKSSEHKTEH